MRTHLATDDVPRALAALNEQLGNETSARTNGLDGDRALLLLERATLLSEVGKFTESARDFELADRRLDVADMLGTERDHRSRGFGVDATGCIQGSPSCPYRTIPAEKLMINTMAALAFLAMHRPNEAAIEGRRIDVTRRFLDDRNILPRTVLSLSSFLAAIAFEKNGNAEEAKSSRKDVPISEDVSESAEDVVIVVGYGRGPYRTPELVTVASLAPRLDPVGLRAAAEQSKKTVWTTALNDATLPRPVAFELDDESFAPELAWDVGSEVASEWRAVEESRLPSRVIPVLDCESARLWSPCGFAADTRSWETLPARFVAARLHVRAGEHRLVVTQGDKRRTLSWTSTGDGWRVVPVFFQN
jgi:hypothetical protein